MRRFHLFIHIPVMVYFVAETRVVLNAVESQIPDCCDWPTRNQTISIRRRLDFSPSETDGGGGGDDDILPNFHSLKPRAVCYSACLPRGRTDDGRGRRRRRRRRRRRPPRSKSRRNITHAAAAAMMFVRRERERERRRGCY